MSTTRTTGRTVRRTGPGSRSAWTAARGRQDRPLGRSSRLPVPAAAAQHPVITTEGSDFGGVLFTSRRTSSWRSGLNIVVGYAGLLDLGYVGFYAIGAYTVGVLSSEHAKLSWVVVVPDRDRCRHDLGRHPRCADPAGARRLPRHRDARLRRDRAPDPRQLAVARRRPGHLRHPETPGVELFEVPSLDWSSGAPVVDLDTTSTFLKFGINDFVPYYWLALVVIGLVLLFDILVKNSRVGRAWEATREDEDAAELMGVPTFRFKLLAFALGAAIGGLSGALFATKSGFINPQSFELLLSILFLAAVVVGGAGNRLGRHRRRDRRRLLPGALP